MRPSSLSIAAAALVVVAGSATAQRPLPQEPTERQPTATGSASHTEAEAQRSGARALEADASAPTEALARGKWEYGRNNYQEALTWYSRAAAMYVERTKGVPALVGKANTQYRLKDYRAALATLDELAARFPNDVRDGTDIRKKVEKAIEKEEKKVKKDAPTGA